MRNDGSWSPTVYYLVLVVKDCSYLVLRICLFFLRLPSELGGFFVVVCFVFLESLYYERGLNQIPRGIPLNVTTLLLSGNRLTNVPDDAFIELRELRELDLSSNRIAVLQHDAFRGLGSLTTLSVWNNQLTLSPHTYPVDVFAPLLSLHTLVLNGNARHVVRSAASSSARRRMKSGRTVDPDSPDTAGRTLRYRPERPGREASDSARASPRVGIPEDSAARRTDETSPGTGATRSGLEGEDVAGGQDVEQGYPDEALSHLHSLRRLAIDGLTNRTLGRGFASLTQLTHVDMNGKTGHCGLVTLHSATLANLVNVTHLNLSDCRILSLTQDAFSSLENLEELDLSFNQALGFDLLGEAFSGLSHTKLRNLTIDSVVPARSLGVLISSHQLRFFGGLVHLEALQARFNRIEAFDNGALCSGMPPNLKYVNVDGNLFELAPYINDLWCLEALVRLDMEGLNTYWTPPLRPPDPEDVCSKSHCRTRLARRDEDVRTASETDPSHPTQSKPSVSCEGKQFSVPPKLETFRARDFGLLYKLDRVRVNASNSLKRIDLSENHFPAWEGRLCGFHNVTELHLMDTMTEYIDRDFFSGFPALEILNISGNRLREVFMNDLEGEVLQGLKNLRVLDMSRNDLGHIPNETLRHLDNLEELYLRVNGMGTLTLELTHMKKLHYLDISKNQLHTIPKPVRDHLDWVALTYNVTINMTFNPIACICSNIDFLEWVRNSKVDFGTTYNYFCLQTDGSLKYMEDIMATIAELDRQCGSFVGVFVGATACCVVVVVLMAVALAYRFRWKLRYLYYASRLGLQRRSQQERQQHFHYDAFVSFASEDDDFVNGELRRRLEDEQGLRLCIHTRDFMPGQYIASNIVDSVQRSRRTLVVLTRALLNSDWCHYELQMALMEGAHTGRDVLLFLLYEHVPAHELSRDMLANLQATVYLEFPPEEEDRDLFWGRLTQALRV